MKLLAHILITSTLFSCMSKQTPIQDETKLESSQETISVNAQKPNSEKLQITKESALEILQNMITLKQEANPSIRKSEKPEVYYGAITCKFYNAFNNCFYYVRVSHDDFLKGPFSIPKSIAKNVVDYFKTYDQHLESENILKSDLSCVHDEPTAKAQKGEKLTCSAYNLRTINEAIFETNTAEELAETLSEAKPFNETITKLHGSILCQQIAGTSRSPCVIRPIINGILQDKFIESSQQLSKKIYSELLSTLKDMHTYNNSSHQQFKIPMEIIGTIFCHIDSSNFKSSGKRMMICKITI